MNKNNNTGPSFNNELIKNRPNKHVAYKIHNGAYLIGDSVLIHI